MTGKGARQSGTGGHGGTWGRPSAAPLAAQGRASLADIVGSTWALLIDAARADGTQGDPPPPRDREQQGAAG